MELQKGHHQKAISLWHKTHKGPTLHYPTRSTSLIAIIHRNEALRKYLKKRGKQLGNRNYEKRKRAMNELQKAGVLALPVVRNLEKNQNPEIRQRAGNLLDQLQQNWPGFFD